MLLAAAAACGARAPGPTDGGSPDMMMTGGAGPASDGLDTGTVTSIDVTIPVRARTFGGCVEISKTSGSGTETGKSYTLCPGVGKVRELGRSGIGQSQELTSYRVAS